jgi:hypothetical protein
VQDALALLEEDQFNFLVGFGATLREKVKARIYSLVQATDMAKHKELTAAVTDGLMPLISANGGSGSGGSVTIERPISPRSATPRI